MKTSQFFPLVISSLVVGEAMLFSTPAQSLTFTAAIANTTSFPQIGSAFVFSGLGGRPLNIISITSPEFPITLLSNNNTIEVSASIFGGVVQPGELGSATFDIEDNPDGTSGFRGINAQAILATPTGIQVAPLPLLSLSATTSAGAETPFSAYRIVSTGELNGEPFDFTATLQAPGDQVTFFDAAFTGTFQVSSQAIPGYVPFDQLNNFGPPIEITLVPGGSTTVTNPQPIQTTPEPSVVVSLSALSFGIFLKRRSLKNNAKARKLLLT